MTPSLSAHRPAGHDGEAPQFATASGMPPAQLSAERKSSCPSGVPRPSPASARTSHHMVQVLYDLLALPYLPGSRLLLLGIANSIDLTERTLSRLPAKVGR